jgi:glucosyl-3-phosphoglycerate synthase
MSDFFQDGSLATLHRLGPPDTGRLERELEEFSAARPIALVLPCHADELGSEALREMINELRGVRYLAEIVVGVDGAGDAAWRRAQTLFDDLPQRPALIWNDGPAIAHLIRRLAAADLDPGPAGKGRNLWMCFGYVLASGRARVVAAHDCDIHAYSRDLLARLCYPVAHPHLGFDFCKGYSARFTDRLNGRVMRLLFTPLIRACQSVIGPQEFLTFLDTFRYPLSGDVSLDLNIIRRSRMPCDWGVEAGMLAEVFRISPLKSLCQIDVAECYDHKHRELSPQDPHKGLNKMARDIARRLFRTLAGQGVKLDQGIFDAILAEYVGKAGDTMRFCAADAGVNGLGYDRQEEELAVATFAGSIRAAATDYLLDPAGDPTIPDWASVDAVLPDFLPALLDAVRSENPQMR